MESNPVSSKMFSLILMYDMHSKFFSSVLEGISNEDAHNLTMSHYELIAFMTYREANCIGQIALWRRLLGYEAMKYM